MSRTDFNTLLDAGVHFGHLKRKWNPKMAPYIFMEKNGIHIIDLHKTVVKLDEAAAALKQIAKSGRRVLFVATKKQAKEIVAEKVAPVGMPYVTERWAGGMLTNFPTIRKAVKKMATIDKMLSDGTFDNFSKREKLQIERQRAKLEKNLGSIADLTRLPAALFVVDVQKEANAVKEAKRLSIPVFAMVDTCCDPTDIDYVIPANDDAQKSIATILDVVCSAIAEGTEERKLEKEKEAQEVEAAAPAKQAKEIVAEKVAAVGMPYVTERWAGGMLTNFPTIRKAVKKMATIDKMTNDGTFDNFSKREKLQIARQRAKLEKNLGSIADLNRLPAALFVIDVQKEQNAVKEAKRLSIPVFAMVDTCCDPTDIDYVIPANDDAAKSIATILDVVCGAIAEGAEERKLEKEKEAQETEAAEAKQSKPRIKKAVKAAVDAEEAIVAEAVAATEA